MDMPTTKGFVQDMPWIRICEEYNYIRNLMEMTKIYMGTDDERQIELITADKICLPRPFLKDMYLIQWRHGDRKPFNDDANFEARTRRGRRVFAGWHNLEVHKMEGRDREKLFVTVPKQFEEHCEWNEYLNVPTPVLFSYFTSMCMERTENNERTKIARILESIGDTKFVVMGLLCFFRACYEGFAYNRGRDPRMYADNPTGIAVCNREKARGRITMMPSRAWRFLEVTPLSKLFEGEDIDVRKAYRALFLYNAIDWSKTKAGYFNYDWENGSVHRLEEATGNRGEEFIAETVTYIPDAVIPTWPEIRVIVDTQCGYQYRYEPQDVIVPEVEENNGRGGSDETDQYIIDVNQVKGMWYNLRMAAMGDGRTGPATMEDVFKMAARAMELEDRNYDMEEELKAHRQIRRTLVDDLNERTAQVISQREAAQKTADGLEKLQQQVVAVGGLDAVIRLRRERTETALQVDVLKARMEELQVEPQTLRTEMKVKDDQRMEMEARLQAAENEEAGSEQFATRVRMEAEKSAMQGLIQQLTTEVQQLRSDRDSYVTSCVKDAVEQCTGSISAMYEERIMATEKKFTRKVEKLEVEKDAKIATVRGDGTGYGSQRTCAGAEGERKIESTTRSRNGKCQDYDETGGGKRNLKPSFESGGSQASDQKGCWRCCGRCGINSRQTP